MVFLQGEAVQRADSLNVESKKRVWRHNTAVRWEGRKVVWKLLALA
jgi:hypothetical protein